MCSNFLAGNGAMTLAFPTVPTTASGSLYCLSASGSNFGGRIILGTFWDVPGRILHFCLRVQSVCEVVMGCNWRCRRIDMSAIGVCNG
jgi:hypothetical protein